MTKEEVIEKITECSDLNKSKKEIIKWIEQIPKPSNIKFVPTDIEKGDIYFSGQLLHHLVVFKIVDDGVICLMLTSESGIPTESRYVKGFFSSCIIKCNYNQLKTMKFSGIYGNKKHLTAVYNQLKAIL